MTREDEIFKKLKNGDESGAAELVELYYEDILRYCMFRLPDRYLAEDAVQETFLKVFRYFDDYRHKGRFRAFLYKVAGNTCIDIVCFHRGPGDLDAVSYDGGGSDRSHPFYPFHSDGMVQEKRMNGQTMRKQMRKEAPDVDQFHIRRLLYVRYARGAAAVLARTGIR